MPQFVNRSRIGNLVITLVSSSSGMADPAMTPNLRDERSVAAKRGCESMSIIMVVTP